MKKLLLGLSILLLVGLVASTTVVENRGIFDKIKSKFNDLYAEFDSWKSGDKAKHEAKSVQENMESYLAQLKHESHKLQESAEDNLKSATGTIRREVGRFKDNLEAQAQAQKARAAGMYEQGKDKLEDAYETMKGKAGFAKEKVKDNMPDGSATAKLNEAYEKTKGKLNEAVGKGKEALDDAMDADAVKAAKARLNEAYEKLKTQADSLDKEKIKEAYEEAKAKLNEAYESAKDQAGGMVDRAKKTDFGKILKSDKTVSEKLHRGWEAVRDVAAIESLGFESKTRTQTKSLKEKINSFLDKAPTTDGFYGKAAELKDQIVRLEQRIASRAKSLANMFTFGVFKGSVVPHHHVHHPFITCGSCKTLYSLEEFLAYYDPQHSLNLVEENFWSDKEVEEFWEGWVEYANHMKLHCLNCGASQWTGVEFAIDGDNNTLLTDKSILNEPVAHHGRTEL